MDRNKVVGVLIVIVVLILEILQGYLPWLMQAFTVAVFGWVIMCILFGIFKYFKKKVGKK